jgi:hypothetical protein
MKQTRKEDMVPCPTCHRPLGYAQRNAAIVRAREAGELLESLAARYRLTKARIHAICLTPDKWKGLAH